MHILLAPDSFKESLSAKQVAEALKKGFKEALPEATFDLLPIGDGGEGTMDTLAGILNLTKKHTQVTGPFGQPVSMSYYQKDEIAFFEMASLVGLGSIPAEKRNPLELETRGIGELILHLVDQGVQTICVGIGGSATNDGGIGMAAGLGVAFYDDQGHLLRPVGASLGRVARIDTNAVPKTLQNIELQILTDVTNPLCGSQGATYIFGGQKGLNPLLFPAVDQAMQDFYQLADARILSMAGAGAGGGMAAGLVAFAGGHISSGIEKSLDLIDFDRKVQRADVVVVGEGRMDQQSLSGKAPVGVAKRTPAGIPVIAICGSLGDDLPSFPSHNISAAFSIVPGPCQVSEALENAEKNLISCARNIGQLLKI
ncbi:Glycerate kinase [Streptococcus parasanguinis]|uniref:glycerate kinase n=1 Tax=Streptococcus parasanguinis TaxID=1318 RepID=UPI00195F51E1|nr:glycerate kinase [Streptococcus parasanguinis]VTY20579.1 Glycerate kinase [Streptococcus parasanguinis]